MKVLHIPDIGGLFYEMFAPEENFDSKPPSIINGQLDGNSFFWASIFNKQRISNLVEELEENIAIDTYDIIQYHSILSNKERFINKCLSIPNEICNEANTPEDFFSTIELSAILCKLYSDFEFFPFEINIQEGFILNQTSSKFIYDSCLNKMKNPYLTYIKKYIFPVVEKYKPDIIFLEGQMSFYLGAISLLSKTHNPNVHICLTNHASEYFSYNKIVEHLLQNDYLFKMIDSIVLEYFEYTEQKLIYALECNGNINDVPNLIYIDKNEIKQTNFSVPEHTEEIKVYKRMADSLVFSNKVYDIHFEPYMKCHWNKCTFCGINKKYHHQSIKSSDRVINDKIQKVCELSKECDYIWFIDEALTPEMLEFIAKKIIESPKKIVWQARCRASEKLLENGLPELLSQSGLIELRIGLESASYFILSLMNKFENNFSLELIDRIVSKFDENDISVHCPVIIGFPQEDHVERQKTFEYLSYLSQKYNNFSFNINVLNIDISSTLYKEWGKYQVCNLEYPCLPKHFLGNSICWIEENKLIELSNQGNKVMKENMFPWLPTNSLVSPTVFYRFCETSRNILRWKHQNKWKSTNLFSTDMILLTSNELSITMKEDKKLYVYDWKSHHYLVGNKYILEIINIFNKPKKISIAIKQLVKNNPGVYVPKELVDIIYQLYINGFLLGNYVKRDITDTSSLIKAYDNIYKEGDLIYSIETDDLLKEYEHEFGGGNALELGVGLGKNIDFLLSKNYKVTGIDLSAIAIQTLTQRYAGDNCSFIIEDIRNYHIKPNHYSLIVCSMVLSYFSDEELYVISKRIVQGLKSGGYLYFIDLSERDPLFDVKPENTTDHRNFFSCKKVEQMFSKLDLIELSDVLKYDTGRVGCHNLFGLIKYLGYKK